MEKKGIHFAWFVLTGMFINYMAVVGILIYTLPLFYPSLMAELNWSSQQVTLPVTLCFFIGAFLTPLVSACFDRYSVRRFMVVGSAAIIFGLLLYGAISSIAFMIGVYFLFALGQVFSGQVPAILVVTRWFQKRRGLALGILLTASSFGGAIFPLVVRYVMDGGDWRQAALTLAVIAALTLTLPLWLLIRNRPQAHQLEEESLPDRGPLTQSDPGPTLAQALKSPDFYLLAFATGALWFTINGMVQHQSIIMGTELGADSRLLPLIVSVFFWSAIFGKVVFGWLADRLDKTLVMLMSVLCLLLGLSILASFKDKALFAYALFFGMGFGGTFTMMQVLFAEYYAGLHYGKILGTLTMVDVACGGIGIPALAMMRDSFGTYQPVLTMLMTLSVLITLSVFVLYRRRRRLGLRRPVSDSSVVAEAGQV